MFDGFMRLGRAEQLRFLEALVDELDENHLKTLHELIMRRLSYDPLAQLPLEVCLRLLSNIAPLKLIALTRISRHWRSFINTSKALWLEQFHRCSLTDTAKSLIEGKPEVHTLQRCFQYDTLLAKNWRRNLCRAFTVACHDNHVITCLQVDDGTGQVIAGSDDGTVSVWDARSGRLVHKLVGHQGGVWALKAVDGVLVTGSTDRSLIVWDLKLRRRLCDLVGHASTVRCLEIAGEFVVSGARDGVLRVWHWPTGRAIHVLAGHTASIRCLALHGTGQVISGSYDGTLRLWDIASGECLAVFEGHRSKVYSVVSNGHLIFSGSMDSTVRVWDPTSGQCVHILSGHKSLVGNLALGDRFLASGAVDGSLRIWDLQTNQSRLYLGNAHPSAITCLGLNHLILATGSESMVKFWTLHDGSAVVANAIAEDIDMVWRVAVTTNFCVIAFQSRGVTKLEFRDYTPMYILQ